MMSCKRDHEGEGKGTHSPAGWKLVGGAANVSLSYSYKRGKKWGGGQ